MLASLNYPGIAAIYGIEESDDTRALVLELVEGPTLADQISKGIPLDEALLIAKQIAEALEAAHEAGVIHRDLKPANIKVRDDGTVKVLDFGLAKALDTTPQGDPSQSPTLTAAATQMGVILGTAAYMSPEQARGKPVDKRADIWAFGAVLYEMLTGKRAFEGEDVSVILADVIRADPVWDSLPTELSPGLVTCLRQCLHKDSRRRLRDIGDMRLALDGVFDVGPPPTDFGVRRSGGIGMAVVIAVGIAASVLTGLVLRYLPVEPRTVTRLRVSADTAAPAFSEEVSIALSPDGRTVVYVGVDDAGARELYVRPLDRFGATPIPGTAGALAPFFSPNGSDVAFAAEGELRRVSLMGGLPTTVCAMPVRFGAAAGAATAPSCSVLPRVGCGRSPLVAAPPNRSLRSVPTRSFTRSQTSTLAKASCSSQPAERQATDSPWSISTLASRRT